MSTSPTLYDLCFVFWDGQLLAENMEVSTQLVSDIAQIKTIPKGFSGITPGSPVRTIKLKNAIPIAGPEVNFEKALLNSELHEIKIQLGGSGKSCKCRGFVIGPVGLDSSVGKATDQDVEFVGTAEDFA